MNWAISVSLTLFLLFSITPAVAEDSSSYIIINTPKNAPNSGATNSANETTQTTITKTTSTTINEEDTKIVGEIYSKYAKDSVMTGTKLTVTCVSGVVDISGMVTMTSQADQAVILAKSVAGVKDVRSSISVTTNPAKSTESKTSNY